MLLTWQVRDMDLNILLPFAPEEGLSSVAEEMLNPPPEQMRFMNCAVRAAHDTPAAAALASADLRQQKMLILKLGAAARLRRFDRDREAALAASASATANDGDESDDEFEEFDDADEGAEWLPAFDENGDFLSQDP